LVKALAGLVLLAGLFYTAKTVRMGTETLALSRETLALSQETLDLSRRAQLAERFTDAVEQLGHKSRDVHIGGIYALADIVREEPSYVVPITEILTAFVREHARQPSTSNYGPATSTCTPGECHGEPLDTDVQAAMTVLGRRFRVGQVTDLDGEAPDLPDVALDLTRVNLHGVDLHELDWSSPASPDRVGLRGT
jgi:hypothetical protein